eukprot:scaffold10085_cov168-Amphora_coffeaeformis.AAC.2
MELLPGNTLLVRFGNCSAFSYAMYPYGAGNLPIFCPIFIEAATATVGTYIGIKDKQSSDWHEF